MRQQFFPGPRLMFVSLQNTWCEEQLCGRARGRPTVTTSRGVAPKDNTSWREPTLSGVADATPETGLFPFPTGATLITDLLCPASVCDAPDENFGGQGHRRQALRIGFTELLSSMAHPLFMRQTGICA